MAWARSPAAVAVREALLGGVFGPSIGLYASRRVVGREQLDGLQRPVLFVASHASHVDTPVILGALPAAWRRRTAVAAAADYFYARPLVAAVVSLAFNTVPVQRSGTASEPGAVEALDRLIGEGWSLVIYAEGTRSRDGSVGRLLSGAAVLAERHGLPLVPVCVSGTHALMPAGRPWPSWTRRGGLPRRRPVEVRFGPPVHPGPEEHRTEVMERIRRFFAESGAVTTPDARLRSRRPAAS